MLLCFVADNISQSSIVYFYVASNNFPWAFSLEVRKENQFRILFFIL